MSFKEPEVNEDGMMLIDPKDPNRPRFTKQELMQVIEEKANLSIAKMHLEDELGALRSVMFSNQGLFVLNQ